jgi:hypothetical protein
MARKREETLPMQQEMSNRDEMAENSQPVPEAGHQKGTIGMHAAPRTRAASGVGREFEKAIRMPIAMSVKACRDSMNLLNRILQDTMSQRDFCGEHRLQAAGHTFYPLPLQAGTARKILARLCSDASQSEAIRMAPPRARVGS